jgi:hypothetical protein
MSDLTVPKLPQSDSKQRMYQFISGAVSLVTLDAAGLFSMIMKSPLEKRREDWLELLADGLEKLQRQIAEFDIEKLSENEALVTTIAQLTYTAISTHETERRYAIRNAILNTALKQSPDDIRQKQFNRWLDELTPWHWKILPLFDDPHLTNTSLDLNDNTWMQNAMLGEVAILIENTYPEMIGEVDLYVQVVADLHSRGLIANIFPEKLPGDGLIVATIESSPKLTELAREFLKYIQSPLNES